MLSENPYIAGNSVGGSPAFVGRTDILRNVRQVLRHRQQNAILLYGQRRIGKTSVLKELETKLKNDSVYHPIFFDLLGKAHQSLEEVLRELADTISEALVKEKADLGNKPKTEFSQNWLPNLLNNLGTKSLVLLFDEFDALDDPASKKTSNEFFNYLRELLTTSNPKRLSFVFVIGRNIDDMDNIAQAVFKKGIPTKRVSLLNYDDTVKLIRFSVKNKSLCWSNEVIKGVWQLTNGHPFLTQCLCSHVWENLYDDKPNNPPVVTLKNIEAAIPKTLESSQSALEWLWDGLPPAERIVISALAEAGAKPITKNELEHLLRKSGVQTVIQDLQNAPRILQEEWNLIEQVNSGYRFRVKLLRRWIAKHKPLNRVQEELDQIEPVANNLYQAALGLYNKNKLDEAVPSLQQAIKFNPNHGGANQLLAEIFLAQNKTSDACEILEKLYRNQPSSTVRDRLIQALLTLAQTSDDEDYQLRLYKRVLELDAEHSEAKRQLLMAWELQGNKASKAGDLGTALTAYRNAALDDKGAEVEEKIHQQTQLYQQTLDKYSKLNILLITVVVVIGSASWLFFDKLSQTQEKYEELQTELQNVQAERQETLNDNERLQTELQNVQTEHQETQNDNERLQASIKQLKKRLALGKFVSKLKKGTYIVSIVSFENCRKDKENAQKRVEKFKKMYPELGAEKFLTSKGVWVVQLGKFYSKNSADKLIQFAINYLDFPSIDPDKPFTIDVGRSVHREKDKSRECS